MEARKEITWKGWREGESGNKDSGERKKSEGREYKRWISREIDEQRRWQGERYVGGQDRVRGGGKIEG